MLLQSHLAAARVSVVVVVPAITQRDNTKEVVVDAVIGDREIAISEFGDMAHDVQNQWHIPREEACQKTCEHHLGAEACPEEDAEQNAEGYALYVGQTPVIAAFEPSVDGILP